MQRSLRIEGIFVVMFGVTAVPTIAIDRSSPKLSDFAFVQVSLAQVERSLFMWYPRTPYVF